MSNPILSLYNMDGGPPAEETAPFSVVPRRADNLASLRENPNVDLLILGGGLTGALVAHQAALQGVRVLVLERRYCGDRALSWDHRIAQLLRVAPRHFLLGRSQWKVLAESVAPHLVAALPPDSHEVTGLWPSLVKRLVPLRNLDERLLIRESMLAARQEGAIILSAVEPTFLEAESLSGCYRVGFKDTLSEASYEVRVGGVLVDPSVGELPATRLGSRVLPWSVPAVAGSQRVFEAVPASVKSGERFASYELTDGSCVSVSRIGEQVLEVTAIFGASALAPDVVSTIARQAAAEAGWNVQREVHSRDVDGRWSRHWRVNQDKGIFTCEHRGPWDALKSSATIVRTLVGLLKDPRPFKKLPTPPLPGAEHACELQAFRALARAQGIRERVIELCIARWRGRVRYIAQFPNGFFEVCPNVLRGEIDLAVASDQVTSVEDLMFGSLMLQQLPEWRELVKPISERFAQLRNAENDRNESRA